MALGVLRRVNEKSQDRGWKLRASNHAGVDESVFAGRAELFERAIHLPVEDRNKIL